MPLMFLENIIRRLDLTENDLAAEVRERLKSANNLCENEDNY